MCVQTAPGSLINDFTRLTRKHTRAPTKTSYPRHRRRHPSISKLVFWCVFPYNILMGNIVTYRRYRRRRRAHVRVKWVLLLFPMSHATNAHTTTAHTHLYFIYHIITTWSSTDRILSYTYTCVVYNIGMPIVVVIPPQRVALSKYYDAHPTQNLVAATFLTHPNTFDPNIGSIPDRKKNNRNEINSPINITTLIA